MNLTLYFRLIVSMLFQPMLKHYKFEPFGELSYDHTHFFCPRIHAKDGFNVSLQINNGNYCSSENGYRQFGLTWKEVEFGFPTMEEELMKPYAEQPDIITDSVGCIPLQVMEQVFEKHGGIDWETTLSEEHMRKFLKL